MSIEHVALLPLMDAPKPPAAPTVETEPRVAPARIETAGAFPAHLIHGIPARDPDALTELFTRYFPRVYNLAYRVLGDRTQAEDTSQDVFLKAYRGAPNFDVTRDPWPWLVRITYNACRDHWRSWSHRLARGSDSLDATPDAEPAALRDTDNPERRLIRSEESARVQRAILQLSPENRAIVLMHDYEGLRHDEIAEVIGVSAVAVRKRYSRSLAQLAKHLKHLEESSSE